MISNLAKEITPFIVMEVLEKASEMERMGLSVIHMEVGEPDFDIPLKVKEASDKAIRSGYTHYTHSLGDLRLRNAIAAYHSKNYGTTINPDNIVVTSGSSPAILLVLASILNPDDEVIVSDPGYACYANFIRTLHGKPIRVPVYAENGFQYYPKDIATKITEKTKAIFINSPMNPSGNLLSAETMKDIAKLGPLIISDEIYHGLVYEGKPHSILEFSDNAFVVNGFSKAFAMTGLRLGYCISPKEYVRAMQKLQQNLFICAGSVSQQCGIVALEECEEELAAMKKIYNERRLFMIRRLRELGFTIPVEPTGAFYVLVDARHISNDSYKLAFDILAKAHVGVTPGVDFGPNGEGFLRFSYANSLENIKEGLNRLEKYLDKINQ